jgi:DNA-binding NarL/FixJ family response regulator
MQTPARPIRVVIAARTALRRTYREALSAAGMQVAADCGDAAELLAAVSREHPDVCVLDRELRGGGLVATAAIAVPRRAPKVLVVGGRGSAAELRAARLAGAAASLPTDIDAAELAAAVAALVEKEKP